MQCNSISSKPISTFEDEKSIKNNFRKQAASVGYLINIGNDNLEEKIIIKPRSRVFGAAFLVAEKIVLTVGSSIKSKNEFDFLEKTRLVFKSQNFKKEWYLMKNDMFSIKKVLTCFFDTIHGNWALLELVESPGRKPLSIQFESSLSSKMYYLLPLREDHFYPYIKIEKNDNEDREFKCGGRPGLPVFNEKNILVGMITKQREISVLSQEIQQAIKNENCHAEGPNYKYKYVHGVGKKYNRKIEFYLSENSLHAEIKARIDVEWKNIATLQEEQIFSREIQYDISFCHLQKEEKINLLEKLQTKKNVEGNIRVLAASSVNERDLSHEEIKKIYFFKTNK
ncbi:MAG: hypothetical protein H0V82_03515 [Candidatus Protochlamydia sp.]|nr:hypothetical protein [Candidatus Protochlamydia sp.]